MKQDKILAVCLNEVCFELGIKDFNVSEKVMKEVEGILMESNSTKEFYSKTLSYIKGVA